MDRHDLIRELKVRKEWAKRQARKNYFEFVKWMRPEFNQNWHHRLLCEYLDKFAKGEIKRLMVFMPPQHGKSEYASRLLPSYILGQNPNKKIICCSYSNDLATKINRAVQRNIESTEYNQVFPGTRLNSKNVATITTESYLRNAEMFEVVDSRGFFKRAGVSSSLTGTTGDIAIIDDPVKDRAEADSLTIRDRTESWYNEVLMTRLHNEAQILVIQTRWHEDDLSGRILKKYNKKNNWVVLTLEALKRKVDHPQDPRNYDEALWPERHNEERIREMEDADERGFQALWQQDPQPVDGDKYCYNFKRAKHIKSIEYLPMQLQYSVDFNTKPYMSGVKGQLRRVTDDIWNGHREYLELRIFGEYALKHPDNTGRGLGEAPVKEFGQDLIRGFFLYGDASGNNKTGISQTKTLFEDVYKGLGKYLDYCEKRIPNANPRYAAIAKGSIGRRSFINELFAGRYAVRVLIDPSCEELIKDLDKCTADANGKLAKPKNKEGVEERGHHLQALEYMICHHEFLGYLAKIPNKEE